jgi:hypothetical protein
MAGSPYCSSWRGLGSTNGMCVVRGETAEPARWPGACLRAAVTRNADLATNDCAARIGPGACERRPLFPARRLSVQVRRGVRMSVLAGVGQAQASKGTRRVLSRCRSCPPVVVQGARASRGNSSLCRNEADRQGSALVFEGARKRRTGAVPDGRPLERETLCIQRR